MARQSVPERNPDLMGQIIELKWWIFPANHGEAQDGIPKCQIFVNFSGG
jgi:hypothetical protein